MAWQPEWDLNEARLLAEEIFDTALLSNSANFRLAVSFNCPANCPYFPVASAGENRGFALGLENSGLLHQALLNANDGGLNAVCSSVLSHLTTALQPMERVGKQLERDLGVRYLGIDTSIAPALNPPSIPEAFEATGICSNFASAGSLALAERITAALKAVPVTTCGYCGLMLPVCEDKGLAAAAASGELTIQKLLQYSAVCGVGLDTVPVPGPGHGTTLEERRVLVHSVAALILDVAALSNRLRKPLSVRLLPVVGATPGRPTNFGNPYLVESVVMTP